MEKTTKVPVETTYLIIKKTGVIIKDIDKPNLKLKLKLLKKIPVHYYRYLQLQIGGAWLWWERAKHNNNELLKIINDNNRDVFVLYKDNVPAGIVEISWNKKTANLDFFGLMPQYFGRNIGSWLINEALKILISKNCAMITLNTCNLDSHIALKQYKKLGFKVVNTINTMIDCPIAKGYIDKNIKILSPFYLQYMKDK